MENLVKGQVTLILQWTDQQMIHVDFALSFFRGPTYIKAATIEMVSDEKNEP